MKLNRIKYTAALISLVVFSLLTIALPFLTVYWYIINWATKFDVFMLVLFEILVIVSVANLYRYIKERKYNN